MSSAVTTSGVSSAAIIQVLKQLLTRTNVAKVLGTYLIYLTLKYRKTAYGIRTRTDIPGPMGLPFLGNTYQLVVLPRNEVLQRQTANHEKYGPIYTMTIPGIGRIINILDPEMIDHVLRVNFWAYEKGPFLRTQLGPLVGGGKALQGFYFSVLFVYMVSSPTCINGFLQGTNTRMLFLHSLF